MQMSPANEDVLGVFYVALSNINKISVHLNGIGVEEAQIKTNNSAEKKPKFSAQLDITYLLCAAWGIDVLTTKKMEHLVLFTPTRSTQHLSYYSISTVLTWMWIFLCLASCGFFQHVMQFANWSLIMISINHLAAKVCTLSNMFIH